MSLMISKRSLKPEFHFYFCQCPDPWNLTIKTLKEGELKTFCNKSGLCHFAFVVWFGFWVIYIEPSHQDSTESSIQLHCTMLLWIPGRLLQLLSTEVRTVGVVRTTVVQQRLSDYQDGMRQLFSSYCQDSVQGLFSSDCQGGMRRLFSRDCQGGVRRLFSSDCQEGVWV